MPWTSSKSTLKTSFVEVLAHQSLISSSQPQDDEDLKFISRAHTHKAWKWPIAHYKSTIETMISMLYHCSFFSNFKNSIQPPFLSKIMFIQKWFPCLNKTILVVMIMHVTFKLFSKWPWTSLNIVNMFEKILKLNAIDINDNKILVTLMHLL